MKKLNKAVVIGRFQPFHNGHAEMVKQALEQAEKVYILIGSSNTYPNTQNPLTAKERQSIIADWSVYELPLQEATRIYFRHIPDSLYNEERWKTNVRMAINEKPGEKIGIFGYEKDSGSYWLKAFGWEHVPVPAFKYGEKDLSATDIRNSLFERRGYQMLLDTTPKTTVDYVNDWSAGPEYKRLHEEYIKWQNEIHKFRNYPYLEALNCCTADAVVVCNNHLLVITRKFAPGKGAYALPGGHKNADETFLDCAIRELMEEVRIKVPEKVIRGSIRNSMMFDHPKRSLYFSKPTVAQYIKLEPDNDGSLPRVMGGADDALDAFWMPFHQFVENRDKFFDDHADIITAFTGI